MCSSMGCASIGSRSIVGAYTAIVHGDAKCYSIAAASIIAKVVRDRLMDRLASRYPYYGWEHNAGYATLDHRRGIEAHGITAFHRRSFARVRAVELGEQMELDFTPTDILDEVDELDILDELEVDDLEVALASA